MQATLKQWQPWVLSILIGLMPLSFSIDQRIKVLPAAALFLSGLYLLACHRVTRDSYRQVAPVVLAAAAMMVVAILNVLGHRLGWRPVDHTAHILLYLVIAAAFTQPLRMRVVWAGFSLSAIVFGTICLVQHYVLGIERAHSLNGGSSSAIEFAMIMLGLALMALIQLLRARSGRVEKVLHAAGMAFGMYGALLTQSRGPLLAFVPVFLGLVLLHALRTGRWRWSLLLLALASAGGAVATTTLHGEMMGRFAAIDRELVTFDHRHDANGSVRERLEMWRTAARAFTAHPLAGIGIDQFDVYVAGEVAAGRSNASISRFNHPHNEYLEAAATGGIPGLLALLLIFVVPLRYFARYLRDPDDTVAVPATAAVAVIGLYVLCGMTDSVFYRVMSQSFYFFLMLGLAVLIGRQALERKIRH